MTDNLSYQTESDSSAAPQLRPLPITIVPGMRVVDMTNDAAGTIVGFTQAFCIFRIEGTESLCVANWRNVSLGPVCPADPAVALGLDGDRPP